MQQHHVISIELFSYRCIIDMVQYQAAARFDNFAEDSRQPLPQPYLDPPLPSGPAPTITPAEAACVCFNSRNDLLRFLLLPGAFGAMVMA